jgi:hypothetical protein
MLRLLKNLRRKTALATEFVDSALRCHAVREDARQLTCFCLFLGYPRSGHSLVGSLMDAHPDMIFAHEANALKAIRYGFRKTQLVHWLLHKSERFTDDGRSYTGYSYDVPGQWQGRYRTLKVIGDKFGNFTVEALVRRPGLLRHAGERVGVPIRFVHVIRNPYDNIATIFKREKYDLPGAVSYYFGLVGAVQTFLERIDDTDVFTVYHEDLVRDPAATVRGWCEFFDVDADDAYVDACAGIVYDSPHRSRFDIDTWTDAIRAEIDSRIAAVPFLREAGYTFADDNR